MSVKDVEECCKHWCTYLNVVARPIHIAVVHENLAAVEKLLYMMQVASVNVDHLNNDRQVSYACLKLFIEC